MSGPMREAGRAEEELQEERDFLLASLSDLDAELAAGDMDPHDYITLKDRYTARATAVLRALDAGRGSAADADPSSAEAIVSSSAGGGDARPLDTRRAHARRWSRVAVATAVAGAAVLAGLLVAGNLGQRLPGTTVTGAVQQTGPEAQLALAQQDLGNGKYLDAIKAYETVLKQDQRNPEALAYRGWILFLTGQQAGDVALIDRGLISVRAAEAADGAYPDAHFFAGMILMQQRDPAGAVGEFGLALADHPPSALVPEIENVLQTAQAQAAGAAPGATSPSTAAP